MNLSDKKQIKTIKDDLSSSIESPQIIIEDDRSVSKKKMKYLLKDLNDEIIKENHVASLASDISLILASEFDDLPTHTPSFKLEIKRLFNRVLTLFHQKEEGILFIDLQMYYAFLFKKQLLNNISGEKIVWNSDGGESIESVTASKLIDEFSEKNKGKAIKIEYIDALIVLFPSSNMKKSLKDMGFYSL